MNGMGHGFVPYAPQQGHMAPPQLHSMSSESTQYPDPELAQNSQYLPTLPSQLPQSSQELRFVHPSTGGRGIKDEEHEYYPN
jgi:hypothetical protein